MTALLEARGVQVQLGGAEIVTHGDLALEPGRLVAVVGPNGAGKTTLTRAVAGLQRISGGTVRWQGEDVAALRGRRLARVRAFVPQRGRVPDGVTVREAVDVGRAPHVGMLRRATQSDRLAVDRALARVDALRFADRRLNTLSGGELQRVQVAVALAQDAPCLIADEPTSALDLGATAALARLLRDLADDGLAVLLVLHDLALAAAVADEVVVVHRGRTVAAGPPAAVLDRERLAAVWGVAAELEHRPPGGSALRVDWLAPPPRTTPTQGSTT